MDLILLNITAKTTVESLRRQIAAGADVNAPQHFKTPIELAAIYDRSDLVAALIEAGSNDDAGFGAALDVAYSMHSSVVVELVLKCKPSPDALAAAVQRAAGRRDLVMLRRLMACGARAAAVLLPAATGQPWIPDEEVTPEVELAMVRYLLDELNLDPNGGAEEWGSSALFGAMSRERTETEKLLLERGAMIAPRDLMPAAMGEIKTAASAKALLALGLSAQKLLHAASSGERLSPTQRIALATVALDAKAKPNQGDKDLPQPFVRALGYALFSETIDPYLLFLVKRGARLDATIKVKYYPQSEWDADGAVCTERGQIVEAWLRRQPRRTRSLELLKVLRAADETKEKPTPSKASVNKAQKAMGTAKATTNKAEKKTNAKTLVNEPVETLAFILAGREISKHNLCASEVLALREAIVALGEKSLLRCVPAGADLNSAHEKDKVPWTLLIGIEVASSSADDGPNALGSKFELQAANALNPALWRSLKALLPEQAEVSARNALWLAVSGPLASAALIYGVDRDDPSAGPYQFAGLDMGQEPTGTVSGKRIATTETGTAFKLNKNHAKPAKKADW